MVKELPSIPLLRTYPCCPALPCPTLPCPSCRITVILAGVGQAVGLVWMIWKNVNYDLFFLDWEKPRKVLSREGGGWSAARAQAVIIIIIVVA